MYNPTLNNALPSKSKLCDNCQGICQGSSRGAEGGGGKQGENLEVFPFKYMVLSEQRDIKNK